MHNLAVHYNLRSKYADNQPVCNSSTLINYYCALRLLEPVKYLSFVVPRNNVLATALLFVIGLLNPFHAPRNVNRHRPNLVNWWARAQPIVSASPNLVACSAPRCRASATSCPSPTPSTTTITMAATWASTTLRSSCTRTASGPERRPAIWASKAARKHHRATYSNPRRSVRPPKRSTRRLRNRCRKATTIITIPYKNWSDISVKRCTIGGRRRATGGTRAARITVRLKVTFGAGVSPWIVTSGGPMSATVRPPTGYTIPF